MVNEDVLVLRTDFKVLRTDEHLTEMNEFKAELTDEQWERTKRFLQWHYDQYDRTDFDADEFWTGLMANGELDKFLKVIKVFPRDKWDEDHDFDLDPDNFAAICNSCYEQKEEEKEEDEEEEEVEVEEFGLTCKVKRPSKMSDAIWAKFKNKVRSYFKEMGEEQVKPTLREWLRFAFFKPWEVFSDEEEPKEEEKPLEPLGLEDTEEEVREEAQRLQRNLNELLAECQAKQTVKFKGGGKTKPKSVKQEFWSVDPICRCNFEPMTDKQWKDFRRFMDATVDGALITACGDLKLKWTGDSEEEEEDELVSDEVDETEDEPEEAEEEEEEQEEAGPNPRPNLNPDPSGLVPIRGSVGTARAEGSGEPKEEEKVEEEGQEEDKEEEESKDTFTIQLALPQENPFHGDHVDLTVKDTWLVRKAKEQLEKELRTEYDYNIADETKMTITMKCNGIVSDDQVIGSFRGGTFEVMITLGEEEEKEEEEEE